MMKKIERLALVLLAEGWKQDFPQEYVLDRDVFGDSWAQEWEFCERIEFLQPLFDYEGPRSVDAPTHRFQHLLLQEYLAAKALLTLYRKDGGTGEGRGELLTHLSKIRYNTGEMSKFLAELISGGRRGCPEEDCRYWHELLVSKETNDWVRTYALEIRDKIASEHEEAGRFLEGLYAAEKVAVEEEATEILVPKGAFIMGSYEYGNGDERPVRLVRHLEEFFIDRYPVTNARYTAFLNECFRGKKSLTDAEEHSLIHLKCSKIQEEKGVFRATCGYEDHPVTGVTWYGAVAYCEWRSKQEGRTVVLPTESMWEKAARGALGRTYPWGNGWDPPRCNTYEGEKRDTTKVGNYTLGEAPLGCSDMAGNVWEWLYIWSYEYKDRKVLRGGSWNSHRYLARCTCPFSLDPGGSFDFIGFRCARTV
jgi:formylglycine-generating enzyme required for sulfatase activity